MVSNPGQVIAEKYLGRIFGKAYENAVKGFEACGIEPFNSQCFSDADFAASLTTDRKLESIEPPRNDNLTRLYSQLNCSFTIEPEERRTKLVIPSLPVAIRKENRRIRQKAPSMVITSTPVKDYLEEKEANKIALQKKKKEVKRKREAKKKQNMEKKNLKKVERNVFDSKGGKSSDSSDSSLSETNYISTDNEDSSEEENQDAHCVYYSQQYSTDTSGEPWMRCIR
ncbi:hypothetical protein JTB14_008530 [Gonioctena quinquepunctata]|nr:hypothetical protein JTB14_008530 [Gonioctena quinquepunctata]